MKMVLSVMVGLAVSALGCASPTTSSEESSSSNDALSSWDTVDVASSTCRTKPGETLVHVTLKVNEYRGVHHGHNGDHEIVEATITAKTSVADPSLVDSNNVEAAMNVHSSTDPSGLPHEIPVAVGDTFEVQGEYIPAATANAHNANGPAAVIHFAHSPCGFVTIAGQQYR
jgi:hypothetical protein